MVERITTVSRRSRGIAGRRALFAACLAAAWLAAACSGPGEALLQAPLLSTQVQVVDDAGKPVAGAVVQVEGGEQATTDAQGRATVRFASLGVFQVRVTAPERLPASFTVTMPLDRAKVRRVVLAQAADLTGVAAGLAGIGNAVGAALARSLYPMMFQALFTAGGYGVELEPYRPGAWTEWRLEGEGEGEPVVVRKACLKRLANGGEWWQMRFRPGKDEAETVIEVLFGPERRSLRRIRQRVGDGSVEEVPVAEGWYAPPQKLTPESVAGAVKRRGVSVEVPAGRFTADLLEFAAGPEGRLRLWRAGRVPGKVVKSEVVDTQGQVAWRTLLTAYGSGATTALASY